MSRKSTLALSEFYERFGDELKRDDVLKLMEWVRMQPHLPEIDEFNCMAFLHSCYCSNEAAKQTIDYYYTTRKHCPEFFAGRDPANEELQHLQRTFMMTPLPKPTKEGYVIVYGKILDPNPDAFFVHGFIKYLDMTSLLIRTELGPTNGFIIMVDYTSFTLMHLVKLYPLVIKKYLFYLQEALPVRLKGLHFVNAVPFIDKVIGIMRPFMKKELMDMFHIHQVDSDTIYDFIPKDCLPEECGGHCGSLLQMHSDYLSNFNAHRAFFMDDEQYVVDESKRPGKPKNAGELFGVEGTFKKLDID